VLHRKIAIAARLTIAAVCAGIAAGGCANVSNAEAEAAAIGFVRALGSQDAVGACALMSLDYRENGFADNDVAGTASCEEKVADISSKLDEEDVSDFRVCGIESVDRTDPRLVVVRTDSRSPLLVSVIQEGGRPVVDDSHFE
jgi:hypothetical protein